MIISLPVHAAVWRCRASGALFVLVATQLFVVGSYFPPVFKSPRLKLYPPHTTIRLPVQTAVCECRPSGAFTVVVAVQLFEPGLYLPPVFRSLTPSVPPHTIISLPLQIAV